MRQEISLFLKKIKNPLSFLKIEKFPSRKQWLCFFKSLNKKEKILFFVFLVGFLSSGFYFLFNFYIKNTTLVAADGGTFVEGMVGYPRFINPIYSPISDIDQSLVELIFSGLMKYDLKGNIVPDLAEKYEIKEDGKVFEVYLKENLFWSDGHPLNADDVVFTIKTIQDSDYKSPQMIKWLGVEAKKISERAVLFKLKNPYCCFLETLTQKIIPKHIWENVAVQNFPLSVYNNLKVIGSGPFKIKEIKTDNERKITSLVLVRNTNYFGKLPYINQITFLFFPNEEELIKSYKKKEIQTFSLNNFNNVEKKYFETYHFVFPRYFALFFNPEKTKILSDINIRLALNYGTDKNEIVEKIFSGQAKIINSPIIPEIYGYNPPSNIYQFNPDLTKNFLEKAGFFENEEGKRIKTIENEPSFQLKSDLKEGSKGQEVTNLQKCLSKDSEIYPNGEISGYFEKTTKEAVIKFQEKYSDEILKPSGLSKGTGIVSKNTREKLNEICFSGEKESLTLKISISTLDQPILKETAEILKEQWEKLGIILEIKLYSEKEIKEVIKERDYEILLFGETLGLMPDLFSFWHSSQKIDPGQNLAIYQNKEVDKILEDARQSIDEKERKEKLEHLQNIILADAPAIFLYNPNYLYFVKKNIKGVEEGVVLGPFKRFINIENWYLKTKRVWK